MSAEGESRRPVDALPVIDIAPFLEAGGTPAARRAAAQALRRASIDIGFFYLAGHGIPAEELDEALARGRAFFTLPLAEKEKLSFRNGVGRFGYFSLGGASEYGAAGDLKERFSLTRERVPGEPETGDFGAGRSQWPDEALLPGFRGFFAAHIAARARVTRALAQAFALSLDLPQEYFDASFTHLGCVLMFNSYPKIERAAAAGGAQARWSFSPHTDYGAFTLLLQDSLGGLEVRNAAGAWIEARPLAGAFVVNIGDMFQMWTNDLYKSSLHRVMNFTEGARISIPLFTYPHGTTEISCLPNCTGPGYPPRYEPIKAEDYNRALVERAARTGKPGLALRTKERLREGG